MNGVVLYVTLDCASCGEEILYGPCITTMQHEGVPTIPYDLAAHTTFHCSHCDGENYTGEFEVYT